MSKGRSLNGILKRHLRAAEDFEFHDGSCRFHDWARLFNEEFTLQVPTPALEFVKSKSPLAACYRPGRGASGLAHTIRINTKRLEFDKLTEAWQLVDFLMQMLHEWQAVHGQRGRSSRLLANTQYCDKAATFGLKVARDGTLLKVEPGRFRDLLKREHVDASPLDRPRPLADGESKLKKWSCGCGSVWAARKLNLSCHDCGRKLQKSETSEPGGVVV